MNHPKYSILSTYIAKTVIGSILIVVAVLTAIELFSEFTREFSDIGIRNYTIWQAFQYVPLMLPQDIYLIFPMAGLLGSLVGLGVLASHSELIVMRASGLSIIQITYAVLKAALMLALAMIVVGEILAPIAQHKAVERKANAMSGGQALMTPQGLWLRNQDNFIHIDKVAPDGSLQSIVRYQFDKEGRLATASFAAYGYYDDTQGWMFNDVHETEFLNDRVTTSSFKNQHWDLSLSRRLMGLTNMDPEQQSLPQIYKYIEARQKNGLNTNRYQFIFWQRVFQPLSILVMILLSVPFVFGVLRDAPMGVRIVIGSVCGFAYYITDQFIGRFAMVYNLPAILAALLPILLFAGVGYALLKKIN